MAIGPVQLLVLGFQQPRFQGEILEELDRLRDNDVVWVVDALVVYKDAAGNVEGMQGSQLGAEELADAEAGATVGALVGLGPEDDPREADAELAVEAVEPGGEVFGQDAWDALAEIRADSAAALILLEHCWAIRCGTRSRGRVGSGWHRRSSAPWTWPRSVWCRRRRPRRWPRGA